MTKKILLPFDRSTISSPYGETKGRTSPHSGDDFAVPAGTPILAGGPGVIHFNGWHNDRAGNVVTVKYDHKTVSAMHCHLQGKGPLAVGTRVDAGAVIGYVGSTGNSTGPHLHLATYLPGSKLVAPSTVYSTTVVTPVATYSKAHITKVQQLLIKLGYDLGKTGADGILGPKTTAAVREFQTTRPGLVVDGLPGPRTLEQLEALTAPAPVPVEPTPGPPIESPPPAEETPEPQEETMPIVNPDPSQENLDHAAEVITENLGPLIPLKIRKRLYEGLAAAAAIALTLAPIFGGEVGTWLLTGGTVAGVVAGTLARTNAWDPK